MSTFIDVIMKDSNSKFVYSVNTSIWQKIQETEYHNFYKNCHEAKFKLLY